MNSSTEKNNQNLQNIRNENKAKLPISIIIFVSAFFAGIVIGFLLMVIFDIMKNDAGMDFGAAWMLVQNYITLPARPLLVLGDLFFITLVILYYRKAVKCWNGNEDEDVKFEKTNRFVSTSIVINSIASCFNLTMFGIALYNKPKVFELMKELFGMKISSVVNIVDILLAFFPLIFVGLLLFYMQKKSIDLIRIMNPEKKGSVYDPKFDKVWYESCDEAERIQIGNASYKTFRITNVTCIGLIVVFGLLGCVFEIGILPFVIPSFICILMNIIYGIESIKGAM